MSARSWKAIPVASDAEQLLQKPEQVVLRNIKRGKIHSQINEKPECEQGRQLSQTSPRETPSQDQHLQHHENEVERNGGHSQRPREKKGHHIRETGGPQSRPRTERNAESGQNQTDEKQNKTFPFAEPMFHTTILRIFC